MPHPNILRSGASLNSGGCCHPPMAAACPMMYGMYDKNVIKSHQGKMLYAERF